MKKPFSLILPTDILKFPATETLYKNLYTKVLIIIGIPITSFFTIFHLIYFRYLAAGFVFVMFLSLCFLFYDFIKKSEIDKPNLAREIYIRIFLIFFIFSQMYDVWVEQTLSSTPWFLLFPLLIFFSFNIKEALIWSSCIAVILFYTLFLIDLSSVPKEIFHLKWRLIIIFGVLAISALIISGIVRSAMQMLFDSAKVTKAANLKLRKEIETRTRVEAELRENEEKLNFLLENIKAAVVVHGPDTKIKKCNKLAQRLLGLSKDQMLGKEAIDPLWRFFNPDGSDMRAEDYPVNKVMTSKTELNNMIVGIRRPSTNDEVTVLVSAVPEFDSNGNIREVIVTFVNITERIQAEEAREEILKSLQKALDNIKTLSGLVPICSNCKKIRDDKGYWNHLETHIQNHTFAKFSHGICPECSEALYGNKDWYLKMKKKNGDPSL